jgi:Uma2 family endonuclease
LIDRYAEEIRLDFACTRCTTFYRDDLEKAFESDSSYYFENAEYVRGKGRLDFPKDPPPELVIEVDVTHSSMNKFPLFAAFGIREVWRYSQGVWKIFALESGGYVERLESSILRNITAPDLTKLTELSRNVERPAWFDHVRAWARDLASR